LSKLIKPRVKNRKLVSKEGIDKYTGSDDWLLDEFGLDLQLNSGVSLEIQTIRLDSYPNKGKCKKCGETRTLNNHKLCEYCNGEDMHVPKEGEI